MGLLALPRWLWREASTDIGTASKPVLARVP